MIQKGEESRGARRRENTEIYMVYDGFFFEKLYFRGIFGKSNPQSGIARRRRETVTERRWDIHVPIIGT